MASRSSVVGSGGSPPQSVEKITRIAQDYEYNAAVPLRYWLRTAATLVREVSNTIWLRLDRRQGADVFSLDRHKSTNAKDTTNKHTSSFFDTRSWFW